jgi:ATP-dependent Lon protease
LALEKVRDQKRGSWSLGVKRIPEALGPGQHLKPSWNKATWTAGVIAGLAWTASGGTVMRLECASLPGKGELKLTGKLGDVMKESAHTAFSFLKSEHTKCGLEASAFLERDFHIHIPAGAVPKEGPSAGMGLAMLMYSAASGLACQPFCAMTGEITLHGRVLAIGGVKEKLLAAYQEGIRHVLLPEANRSDVEHLEIEELESMTCIYVESFWEAFKALFPAKKGA